MTFSVVSFEAAVNTAFYWSNGWTVSSVYNRIFFIFLIDPNFTVLLNGNRKNFLKKTFSSLFCPIKTWNFSSSGVQYHANKNTELWREKKTQVCFISVYDSSLFMILTAIRYTPFPARRGNNKAQGKPGNLMSCFDVTVPYSRLQSFTRYNDNTQQRLQNWTCV